MATKINANEAVKHITMCFQTGMVPMMTGHPGIGKSQIYNQIAKRYKLYPIDIRLSQYDTVDLNGFPMLQANKNKAGYVPMDVFPLDSDPIPDGYTGWLILLDEINSAAQAVQAASYKVVLDHMVGQHKLHPKAVLACAGNLATSGAIVNRQGTAMQTRLVHYELDVDWKIWSVWASANHLAMEVISYINHRPVNLMVFDPNHNDRTFACPRTWEFASRVMKYPGMTVEEKEPSLVGCLGEGVAHEFKTYLEVYKHIPNYDQIKAAPRTIGITTEPMMLVALAGMVGAHITVADLPIVMPYIHRLPMEFQVFALRDAWTRIPKLRREQEIIDWLTVNGDVLI